MGVLDQVMQLRGQGIADTDIVTNLQQQGISPKEITDAINQAQIKNAVSAGNPGEEAPVPGIPEGPPTAAGGAEEALYTPTTQEVGADYAGAAPEAEYYPEAGYGAAAPAMDSDTMIEIANQVFSEKIKKMEKTLEELSELKTLASVKLDGVDERLKKIERIIDTIQIKILEKVGAYGKELESAKKEMSMMQESVRKLGTRSKSTSKKISKKKK